MRVAYVTTADPTDVRGWSGTYHYVAKALTDRGVSLDVIGPLEKRLEPLLKAKEGFHRYALRRRHPRDREPRIARGYAKQITQRFRPEHDLVFSVGTIPVSFLDCPAPIVFWTDATFAGLLDFYPMYTHVSAATVRNGHEMEAAALHRSRLAIYSSDWAAESAIADYGLNPERVAVVPFGANMETDLTEKEAETAVGLRPADSCRLLFVGVEWERKGGDIAIAIAEALVAAGLETRLDIVGSWPRNMPVPPFVNRLGFIDKTSPEGRRTLRELFLRSHFFLLPARADCSPVVLNEAAAHAVPAVAARVGGIPTIVRDGASGALVAAGADPGPYASFMLETLAEPARYRRLALGAFQEHRSRLNWRVAGARVRALLDEVVADG